MPVIIISPIWHYKPYLKYITDYNTPYLQVFYTTRYLGLLH